MSCPTVKCLCDNLVISQAVTFADNQLTINIPSGTYENGQLYCIVVGQSIPTTTTISAPVVITIGDSTTTYPLLNSNCTNVEAYQINSRTRYMTKVYTNIQSGVFKLIGNLGCCRCSTSTTSLPIEETTTTTNGGETT